MDRRTLLQTLVAAVTCPKSLFTKEPRTHIVFEKSNVHMRWEESIKGTASLESIMCKMASERIAQRVEDSIINGT